MSLTPLCLLVHGSDTSLSLCSWLWHLSVSLFMALTPLCLFVHGSDTSLSLCSWLCMIPLCLFVHGSDTSLSLCFWLWQYNVTPLSIHTIVSLFIDPTGSNSIMSHLWRYYCSTLSLPNTPPYIMEIYHSTMKDLPWSTFYPDLAALDVMMKLKLVEHYPHSCFVFVGSVFPQFDWKRIAAGYQWVYNYHRLLLLGTCAY